MIRKAEKTISRCKATLNKHKLGLIRLTKKQITDLNEQIDRAFSDIEDRESDARLEEKYYSTKE